MFSLTLISILSCRKYLDKKSDSSLIVPSTLGDLQALLDNGNIMNYGTPSFGESSGDDYFALLSTYNSFSTLQQHFYTWTPDNYNFQNDWSLAYRVIYYSNLCMERLGLIPKTDANEVQWDNVKGSALFYRAYYFLQLNWLFAKAYDETSYNSDPGIVLRLASDFNKPSVRTSVKQSYEQVIMDAKESISFLPDNPQSVVRPSKAASYGLLARAYLSMRQYDSAGKYSNLCLQIKNTLIDYNNLNDVNPGSNNPFMRLNIETIFFTMMNTSVPLYHPLLGAKVDTLLYSSYDTNDKRKIAFFKPSNGYFAFKGNYAADNIGLFSGITTAEMFLTRAECYARADQKDLALADLNNLLTNRWNIGTFIPIMTATSQEALNIILMERRKELLIRGGLRWIDIKRLNKEGSNISLKRVIAGQTYSLPPNDNRYALPLPKDIVDQGIPQNPY